MAAIVVTIPAANHDKNVLATTTAVTRVWGVPAVCRACPVQAAASAASANANAAPQPAFTVRVVLRIASLGE